MKPFTVLTHAALLWSLHAAALAQTTPTDAAHQAQVAQDVRMRRVADASKHWNDVVAGRTHGAVGQLLHGHLHREPPP